MIRDGRPLTITALVNIWHSTCVVEKNSNNCQYDTEQPRDWRRTNMSSSDSQLSKADELLKFASDIVAAYVANNPIPIGEIPGMIKSIHATLKGGPRVKRNRRGRLEHTKAGNSGQEVDHSRKYIICLGSTGRNWKMLWRYLRSRYNPHAGRVSLRKWGLARRLPDGCAQLCRRTATGVRQERLIGADRASDEEPPTRLMR